MIGLYHENNDIEFYFRMLDIAELKEKKEGLEGRLQNMPDFKRGRKFKMLFSDSEDLIDGLKVNILSNGDEKEYEIKVNDYALRKMISQRRWGSRYGAGDKIDITTETPPRTEAEG